MNENLDKKFSYEFHIRLSYDEIEILHSLEKFLNEVERRFRKDGITKEDIIHRAIYEYRDSVATKYSGYSNDVHERLYPDERREWSDIL